VRAALSEKIPRRKPVAVMRVAIAVQSPPDTKAVTSATLGDAGRTRADLRFDECAMNGASGTRSDNRRQSRRRKSGTYSVPTEENVMITRKLAAAATALVVAAMGTSAMADTPWQAHHPRREQVNNRLVRQDHRINREYREGELTRGQARRLHYEDGAIRHEERIDARFDGGHVTKGEQRTLNYQENQVSRQIGR
jgi:hypothetical protein